MCLVLRVQKSPACLIVCKQQISSRVCRLPLCLLSNTAAGTFTVFKNVLTFCYILVSIFVVQISVNAERKPHCLVTSCLFWFSSGKINVKLKEETQKLRFIGVKKVTKKVQKLKFNYKSIEKLHFLHQHGLKAECLITWNWVFQLKMCKMPNKS